MIIYEQWHTAGDLRVCKQCRQLHGQVFHANKGTFPPLHPNCRCYRAYHHIELEPSDFPPEPQPAAGTGSGEGAGAGAGETAPPAPKPWPQPTWPWYIPFFPDDHNKTYEIPHPKDVKTARKPDWEKPFYQRPGMEIEIKDMVEWVSWLNALKIATEMLILWEDLIYPDKKNPPRRGAD